MPLTPEEIAPCNCNAGVSGTASHHEWFCAEQFQDRIAFAIAAAVKEEREACASVEVSPAPDDDGPIGVVHYEIGADAVRAAIRSREGS